jgi:hypothetical protein
MVLAYGLRKKYPRLPENSTQGGMPFFLALANELRPLVAHSLSGGLFFLGRPLFALTWLGATF